MLKRRKYTEKEYRDLSIINFIIAGFLLIGMIIAVIIEGYERSSVVLFVLMITNFLVGIIYRMKGKKDSTLSK